MTPRPGHLRWSKIKNYKWSNALRVTWSPPPGFSTSHATTSKLGDLWRNGNFRQRQKIQNLVYPDGIFYDKDSEDYRTDSVNPALEIFRRFTDSCVGDKRKADLEMLPNLPLVEYSGLEPLTSTLPVLRSTR